MEVAERIGDSFSRSWAWCHLGFAERVQGEWRRAVDALERSATLARERRSAVEADAFRLAVLGESYLGLGEAKRAHALVAEGLRIAQERGQPWMEAWASLALARVLLSCGGVAAHSEIEAVLTRALELSRGTAGKAFEPLVHVELAELARLRGDDHRRERELQHAYRQFTDMGATRQAERLTGKLTTTAT
jgi:ATP/maltotriose-dependent transcriptional regulator MalT